MKVELTCDYCGKRIYRYPSQVKPHNFCSKACLAHYSNKADNPNGYANLKDYANISANMSELNRELNPTRMTSEVRSKLRMAKLGTGEQKGYQKLMGRHTHRIVAELKLGRRLKPGEVVHHIDGNKLNNKSDNLMVFPSQAEHARWHKEHDRHNGGGDAE